MSAIDAESIESRIIEYLDNAISCNNESDKVSFLNKSQELVIHHDILDNFLDEILGFQNDKFAEVRKFVAGFIEATCKKEPDYFPKIIVNLSMMLADEVPNVLKKVIQALTQLYKTFLCWVSVAKINEEIASTWEVWNQIKNQIFSLIDLTENDGVRTQCVKFIEMVIVCQTRQDSNSKDDDFQLDRITGIEKKLSDIDTLEEEAKQLFEQLVNFQSKIHISSVNLMATMQSLALIARQRSKLFFNKVILAFESLSKNLPPTLAKLQVNSVKKQLKLLLFMLFKHPYIQFSKHQSNITQILLSIGVKQSEINRCIQEIKKRGIKIQNSSLNESKRIKLEVDEDDEELDNGVDEHGSKFNQDTCLHELSKKISRYDAIKAVDITAKDLINRLNNPNVVCDIVLSSLHQLPDNLIVDSNLQLALNDTSVLAKKLAFFLTGHGIGPGIEEIQNKYTNLFENQYKMKVDHDISKKISSLLKKLINKEMKNQQQSHNKVKLTQSGKAMSSGAKIKQLKLEDITKPLHVNEKIKHIENCIKRILISNQSAHFSIKQYENYRKIIGKFSSELFRIESLKSLINEYIFEDIRSRYDILMNAIYQEYINVKSNSRSIQLYSDYLFWIIESVLDTCEPKDQEFFLQKLYLESPLLTDNVIDLFKRFSLQAENFQSTLDILKILIEKRFSYSHKFIITLLEIYFSTDKKELQDAALFIIKEIYQNKKLNLQKNIETFSLECLNSLKNTDINTSPLNDESIKLTLSLYLHLLPFNQKLIHELPHVFVASNANTKRIILRLIQEPIQQIDMNSPEMIILVNNCIDGADILISRVINILTENRMPSTQLVSCVRDLYNKRYSDVRFLIPVLCGFSKKEIIEILPQLIKLNPVVIKEVLNRLFSLPNDSINSYNTPISPSDFMIALHNIDFSKCDLKTIIRAIKLCFEEKTIFTSEVLAVVMQMLIEQNTLPTLLMRTVIQALNHHPKLNMFVMNILKRLILKQVWNQEKVWQGFIKCCQQTMPQSFNVLLLLPVPQLESVFTYCPEIKPALAKYIQELNIQEVQLISPALLEVILSTENAIFSNDINNIPDSMEVMDNNEM